MIQRRGWVVTYVLQKSAKCLLSTLQLMSINQIITQKYGSGHFDPFKITRIRPIGGRLRNLYDQSEQVLRILKLYFGSFQKNEITFYNFFFRFCTKLFSKQLFFNK